MSSVGIFRKVEMDEKPFLVVTLSQTDNRTSTAEALAIGPEPLFFCPCARVRFQRFRLMKDAFNNDNKEDDGDVDKGHDINDDTEDDGDDVEGHDDNDGDDDENNDDDDEDDNDDDEEEDGDDRSFDVVFSGMKVYEDDPIDKELVPFNSSPHFQPNTGKRDKSLLDFDDNYFCKFPVVPLFWCNNEEPNYNGFHCGVCDMKMLSVSYYACRQCRQMFHKECVESPVEIKHPSHPFHSLQLRTPLYSLSKYDLCISCGEEFEGMSYDCTTCELSMHPVCAMRPIPFVVDHPKSHPHPLTFFPTQASLVCNICGLINKFDPTYICIQCVFVIHKDCIGFPHVIRISRHHHRISFTSSLPSRKLSCGVCRQPVDNNYGAYSCNKCDAYFVHSKCATHKFVWDGKELEGVPEEDDIIDDGEPFERIADGIICHPFHNHHLRLEISRAYDKNKYCEGCALPVYEGQFYSCIVCNFILHEACANAPRMKRHFLYPHPLSLIVATERPGNDHAGIFSCSACSRGGNGFYYEHSTRDGNIRLDLMCASIMEPFEYQGHKHPLYLTSRSITEEPRCQMCKYQSREAKLNCMDCNYTICFRCATFPYKVKYKHDNHFLTICDEKEASDQPDWCEICEIKIEAAEVGNEKKKKKERRFYRCSDCCTTLHIECLLGVDIYMKPGKTIKDCVSFRWYSQHCMSYERKDFYIHLNKSLSRPICTRCMCRCRFPIFFSEENTIFCSWFCIKSAML